MLLLGKVEVLERETHVSGDVIRIIMWACEKNEMKFESFYATGF